jgi:mono/diheme cytochrome c family protein
MKNYQMIQQTKKKTTMVVTLFLLLALTCVVSNSDGQARKPWPVPAAATAIKSPLTINASVIADAKKTYTTFCTPCHGNSGKGDGMAAASLNPKPADHTSALVQSESDGSLFWKMSEGRNPMPSYKQILNDNQRWELVAYIRTLKKR